jgi:Domain of unknown function (DUF4129)
MDSRRLIPIGIAVTVLLVVAGAASHGRPLRPGAGTGPTATFFDFVATTTLLFAIAMAVTVVIALRSARAGKGPPRRGRWNLVSALLYFFASLLLAYLISTNTFINRLHRAIQQTHPAQAQPGQPRPTPTPPQDLRDARIRWDEVAIVLIVVGGIGVYLLLSRPERRALRGVRRTRRALADALDESLDDLRRDPDVRRAIIAAYARMERALAYAGLPRAPSEAPYEYLERSLVELDASADAARRLTDLFERAKFSQHEPAESMRDEAIDALVAVRDEVRRPAAAPVTA